MAPVIEKVTQELGINLVKVDADDSENEHLLEHYDIRSIPTFILVEENGDQEKTLGKMIGQKSELELRNWLSEHIEAFEGRKQSQSYI
jgi:thiol-disulfide isomerase/thioredoxin